MGFQPSFPFFQEHLTPFPQSRSGDPLSSRSLLHMSTLELRGLWFLNGRKMARWSEHSRRLLAKRTRAIAEDLAPKIPHSCTHVRGHGGVKGALRQIHRALPRAPFVARFDIAAYYRSMRHDVIEAQGGRMGL